MGMWNGCVGTWHGCMCAWARVAWLEQQPALLASWAGCCSMHAHCSQIPPAANLYGFLVSSGRPQHVYLHQSRRDHAGGCCQLVSLDLMLRRYDMALLPANQPASRAGYTKHCQTLHVAAMRGMMILSLQPA
jgi:hypothetical protein